MTVPPLLGYGARGSRTYGVPPDAKLVYQVREPPDRASSLTVPPLTCLLLSGRASSSRTVPPL